MLYPFNTILLGNKKDWATDIYHNQDERLTHAELEKSDTKDHILYDCIYMKCPEKENTERQKLGQISDCLKAEGGRNKEWLKMGMRFFLGCVLAA